VVQTGAWFEGREIIERVLAEAIRVREEYSPEVGVAFVDYPTRHFAASVFPSGLSQAIRWRTQIDWPYLYDRRDIPFDPQSAPDSVVWVIWQNDRFVLTAPHNY
jgi:hypothetical protein